MDKIYVRLYVPMLEKIYDVWIPSNKKIGNAIILLMKLINEMNDGIYNPSNAPMLYDKITASMYDVNLTIKDANIRSGSELVLI